ncbi:MAG: hypothetical protein AUG51_10050 [Acidobacteria bacterium 13_1_20CM_3_53_8]|nr:MAG: hypothetical protein AUG51_10050 [Acidobacteria bacterium 13_1_20CM_3_53_8]
MKSVYFKQGSGPAFVYVPGIEGTGRMFHKQAEDLQSDHTVIALKLRAEGRYSILDLIEDMVLAVRDAGFEKATVLGESFGGLLTMAAALAHPELIERIILVNTFARFHDRKKINVGVALYSILPYSWIRAYRGRTAGENLFDRGAPEEVKLAYRERTREAATSGYLSRLRIVRDTDLRKRLCEIKQPALVVAGLEDNFLPSADSAKAIAQKLPRARLKLLEGVGHAAMLSPRVRVRDWLAEFENI